MVETFIFGHKSPDSDSITSSIVMTNLEKELGNSEAKAYRLGNINKETEFIKLFGHGCSRTFRKC